MADRAGGAVATTLLVVVAGALLGGMLGGDRVLLQYRIIIG